MPQANPEDGHAARDGRDGEERLWQLQTELEALHKAISIINSLAAELNIQKAMDNVRQVVLDLLGCEKVTLFLVFERKQELRAVTQAPFGDYIIRVKFGEGIAGTVAATGQLMNIADTYVHPLFNSAVDRNTGFRTRNMLCCAISDMTGRNVAVLQALNKHAGGTFTAADEKSLKLFGTHLGNTLAKAKLHDAAQRERKRLSDLYTFFRSMASADRLNELLLLARVALHDVLHAEHAFVFLMDAPRNELWTTFTAPGSTQHHSARVKLGQGLVGGAAAQHRARVLTLDSDSQHKRLRPAKSQEGLSEAACATACAMSMGSMTSAGSIGSIDAPPLLSRTSRNSFSLSGMCSPHAGLQKRPSAGQQPQLLQLLQEQQAAAAGQQHAGCAAGTLPIDSVAIPAHVPLPAMGGSAASLSSGAVSAGSLIDAALMRQIAPALGDMEVVSVLVQPLISPDDKLVGAILAINKQETGSHHDILYEDHYTEADVEAMALFALELGNTLAERSLEVSLASVLSTVGHDGAAQGGAGPAPFMADEEVDRGAQDAMLRSQLLSMYFQGSPDFRHQGSDGGAPLTPLSPMLSSSSGARQKWQRSLTRLMAASRRQSTIQQRMQTEASTDSADRSLLNTLSSSLPARHSAARPATTSGTTADLTSGTHSSADGRPTPLLLRPQASLSAGHQPPKHQLQLQLRPQMQEQPQRLRQSVGPDHHGGDLSPPPSPFELESQLQGPRARGSLTDPQVAMPHYSELEALQPLVASPPSARRTVSGGAPDPTTQAAAPAHASPSLPPPGKRACGTALQQLPLVQMAGSAGGGGGSGVLHRLSNMGTSRSMQARALPQHPADHAAGLVSLPGSSESDALSGPLLPEQASVPLPAMGPLQSGSHDSAAGQQGGDDTNSSLTGGAPPTPSTLSRQVSSISARGLTVHVHSPPVSPRLSATQLCVTQASFFDPEAMLSWDFNFLSFDTSELVKLCYDLFMTSGLVHHFQLSRKTLRGFLTAVASHHHNIPYHNFNHVCHVLHGVCLMMRTEAVQCSLAPEELLALMIAALCHDLDHDGCSNSYHVNSQSTLAQIYNDVSVLENHHCAMTFAVLGRKECALLDVLEPDVRRRLRKGIVAAILSTDMSHHFGVTQDFKKHAPVYDPESEADRLLLLKVLLHASDVGSGVRPLPINDCLSKRVHQEFKALADKEQRAGMPITFAVDPSNPRLCAQVECNFLDYVVIPLWERVAEVIPELQPCFARLQENRRAYQELAAGRATGTSNGGDGPAAAGNGGDAASDLEAPAADHGQPTDAPAPASMATAGNPAASDANGRTL